MSTTNVGLYVQRTSEGNVDRVYILDSHGNTMPMKPEIYIEQGLTPRIENLPDEKDYLASQ